MAKPKKVKCGNCGYKNSADNANCEGCSYMLQGKVVRTETIRIRANTYQVNKVVFGGGD